MDLNQIMYSIDKFNINFIQVLELKSLYIDTSKTLFFNISAILCGILQPDLSIENQYFILVEDQNGFHCIDWLKIGEYLIERLNYWKKYIQELKMFKVIEYSFPDVFPVKYYILNPIKIL